MDWGFYSALRASPDFEQKRRDKGMEMQLLLKQQQETEQQISQQFQGQAAVQEIFNTLTEIDILEQDRERMSVMEKDLRKPVIEGIRKFGGDAKKWLLAGGHQQLTEYRNALLTSDELKMALRSKTNYTQWITDLYKGDRYVKNAVVDGESMPMEEAYRRYSEGEIEELPYFGSEEKADIPYEFFYKTPHPKSPYKSLPVSSSDVFNAIRAQGFSQEQAQSRSLEYQRFTDAGGQPLAWGRKENPYDLASYKAQLRAHYAKQGKQFANYYDELMGGQLGMVRPDGTTVTPMSGFANSMIKAVTGGNIDKGGNFKLPNTAYIVHPGTGERVPVKDSGGVIYKSSSDLLIKKGNRNYLEAWVMWKEADADKLRTTEGNPIFDKGMWFAWDNATGDWQENIDPIDKEHVGFNVLVEVPYTRQHKDFFNDDVGIKTESIQGQVPTSPGTTNFSQFFLDIRKQANTLGMDENDLLEQYILTE